PELLDQEPPPGSVARERLRLAAAAVQREHQLAERALAQRLLLDECLQLADEPRVLAQLELGFNPLLERAEAELVEAPAGRERERQLAELRERRATPERERVAQQLGA